MYSLQDLEQSAAIMMAPPCLVTQQQRLSADQVFMTFRKSQCPYAFCKEILEQSKNDYVLFQAASTIKEAILREWQMLSKEDVESLRVFLLAFVTQKQGVQKYVKEQVLQVVAIIFKRGTLEMPQAARESLFRDVTQLVGNSNRDMQILACSILKAMLNELAFMNHSSDIGLTWEFHTQCKRSFQKSDLHQVFMITVQALQPFVGVEMSSLARQDISALVRFLSLAEQVLSWDFTAHHRPRLHHKYLDATQIILLKPDSSWGQLLLNPSVIRLFFKLQLQYQGNEELSHHALQCLIQLASLTGSIFPDKKSQSDYLEHFIHELLELAKSTEMTGQSALGLSSIINRLVTVFPCLSLKSLAADVMRLFTDLLTDLVCSFLHSVAKEEELQTEDTSYIEAVEELLGAWATLLDYHPQFPDGFFSPSAVRVFTCYVQCHLATPDGLRGSFGSADHGVHLVEICDLEGDDRELFADQLCTIGAFGRLIPDHTSGLLLQLLESRVQQFENSLLELQRSTASLPVTFSGMDNLYEDLHWLLLIAGYFLADDSVGETPLIPQEIITYSLSLTEQTDIQATVATVYASEISALGVQSIPTINSSRADPVIQLISCIFRLANIERHCLSSNLASLLSPQVGGTLVWCLRHWARSYLLPDERNYKQLSVALSSVFGADTDGSRWILRFLLEKSKSNLLSWSAEPQLVEESVLLLLTLVNSRSRAAVAISMESLWMLAHDYAANSTPLTQLPAEVQRPLVQALVLAGTAAEEPGLQERYWNQFLQPLKTRFTNICHQPNFNKLSQEEPVKLEVQSLLESFKGVALASSSQSTPSLFGYLLPVIQDCIVLMNIYHNCPEVVCLVLELYVDLVGAQVIYLAQDHLSKLFEACLGLMETYTRCNLGKHNSSALAEEEHCSDLLLLMKLLANILSKDVLDLSTEDRPGDSNRNISASDVTLYGLNVIIPLMTSEVLKFPSLCSQYFELTTCVCEDYPEKMIQLPAPLFKSLMATLEAGLTNIDSDVTKMSLEAVYSLAFHTLEGLQKNNEAPLRDVLKHFLKVLFDLLLLQPFHADLLQPAAEAFLALICCNQHYYANLVRSVLAQQTDAAVGQRLLEAFNQLTPINMTLTLNKTNKAQFRNSLQSFLGSIKGFLCVK